MEARLRTSREAVLVHSRRERVYQGGVLKAVVEEGLGEWETVARGPGVARSTLGNSLRQDTDSGHLSRHVFTERRIFRVRC